MPTLTDDSKIYNSSDRKIAVKEQFMNVTMNNIASYGRIIETSNDPNNDPRIDFMTQYMMTFVLDKERSKELMRERRERIREETKDIHDVKERNEIIAQINLECIAECMEVFDNFMGFQQRQVILEVKGEETIKYANELNDTYIDAMMACRSVEGESETETKE